MDMKQSTLTGLAACLFGAGLFLLFLVLFQVSRHVASQSLLQLRARAVGWHDRLLDSLRSQRWGKRCRALRPHLYASVFTPRQPTIGIVLSGHAIGAPRVRPCCEAYSSELPS